VASLLREAIRRGEYKPGETLPSEPALTTQFSLSRPTIRQALALLRAEGLIEVKPGLGAFVSGRPPIRLTLSRYGPSVHRPDAGPFEATAPGGRGEVVTVEEQPADAEVAARLELAEGDPVVYRRRHMHAAPDDGVVQIQETRLPLELVRGTLLARRAKVVCGTYAALAQIGYPPARVTEEVAVRMPTPEEATILRLAPGVPVLTVVRLTRDASGRVLELLNVTADGERTVFVYEDLPLSWPETPPPA
jgi:GntR family transcriptional regulator